MGQSADAAEADLKRFGDQLATFPGFEEQIRSFGVATRDMNGHLRDAADIAKDLGPIFEKMPRATREAYASAQQFSEGTLQAMIRPGFGGFYGQALADQARIGADPNAAGGQASEFMRSLRHLNEVLHDVAVRIQTAIFPLIKPALDQIAAWLLEHGASVSGAVEKITKGIGDVAAAFVKSGLVKDAMDSLNAGIENFAGYINSGEFRKDLKSFVADIKSVASAVRWALEKLGILPSAAGAAVVPDPRGDHDILDPDEGQATIWQRGFHGGKHGVEHPQDLSEEQQQKLRDRFHAFGGQGGTRSWRNNNPGNISAGKFATAHGADGSDGRFAHFPTYEAGRKAQEDLWFNSDLYKGKTLAGAVAQWSPPSENDTAGIIRTYAGAVGVDPNTPLSQFTPEQRRKLLDAQQAREGWREGSRQNGVDIPKVAGDSPEVAEARRYLAQTATGAAAQRADSIVKLNPAFALAAAKAIRQARAEGINAGIGSGYRSFGQTGSAYDAQGYSGHSYGLASDFSGIGVPGSAEARRFDEITRGFGLGGYGPDNPREWNHKELGSHLQNDRELLARMRATLGPNGEMVDPQATWAASGYVLPKGQGEKFPEVPQPPSIPLASRTFGAYLAASGAGVPAPHPSMSTPIAGSSGILPQGFTSASPLKVDVVRAVPLSKASEEVAQHLRNLGIVNAANHGMLHPLLHGPLITPTEALRRAGHAINHNTKTSQVSLTHSPTYNVHGTTPEAGLKMAKAQGERGAADLMRNVNPMVA